MTRARKHIVCLSETPYYHITSRCVRRAFLCGVDDVSGRDYEHRRGWLEDRIRVLSSLFAVEIAAYAVMSNHYHLVVKLIPGVSRDWSDDDVLSRWTSLFRGPLLVQRYFDGDTLSAAEQGTLASIASVYRTRLASLSWFMKCLNEPIARRANAEDGCSGHFWEARFHSEPLRSEAALLSAMAYVDLNPVRAGIASTPEDSPYTSIRARLHSRATATHLKKAIAQLLQGEALYHFDVPLRALMPFADNHQNDPKALPIRTKDYLALLDVTGRAVTHKRRGAIDPALASILDRLRLSANDWIEASTDVRRMSSKVKRAVNQTG